MATFPPPLIEPLPTTMLTLPAAPNVAEPERITMKDELPFEDNPEETITFPLTPFDPASAVLIVKAPLEAFRLKPVVKDSEPPVT
jgi:hypothetical protein